MQLRDYQESALTQAARHVAAGRRAPLIVAPTGAGKTIIGTAAVQRHLARAPTNRVVWLAHRAELLDQAGEAIARAGIDFGYRDATPRRRAAAPVQVGSIQTLLRAEDLPPASMVVYDEAHHMVSDEWQKLTARWPGAVRLGLTATPERGDGRGLGGAFDSLTVAASIRELTDRGFLVPCRVAWPGRKLRAGEIAQHPLDAWRSHANGMQTILFAQNVTSAKTHAAEFNAAGVTAEYVDATTPWEKRRRILADFRAGRITVLTNVYVLTEGFDAPAAACCILARGCGTTGMFLQMVGRVLRPAPGKSEAVLIDLRGVVDDHGMPDDDREFSLDGKGIGAKKIVTECKLCPVCQLAYDGPYCPECAVGPGEQSAPEVMGVELVKFAGKRREGDAERVATLRRWVRDARARGSKPGAAMHKYRAVYGDWPPAHIKAAAMRSDGNV